MSALPLPAAVRVLARWAEAAAKARPEPSEAPAVRHRVRVEPGDAGVLGWLSVQEAAEKVRGVLPSLR